jgi:hypothetical protein
MHDKKSKQIKFAACEIDRQPVSMCSMSSEVDFDTADPMCANRRSSPSSPQYGLDTRQKLHHTEWFRHIIINAGLET